MKKKNILVYILLITIIILMVFLTMNRYDSFITNDLSYLTVYNSHYDKQRVGNKNDGGYVIVDIPGIKYDLLLSGGVSYDSSFEDAFLELHPYIKCFAFDGTVEKSPSLNQNYIFIKKNIGPIENENTTNLSEYLNNYKTIFLKMDIEGHEIKWLESLNKDQLDNIAQIAIEFHSPFTAAEEGVFKKINKTHILVHFHGNNYSKLVDYKGIKIPDVFECTYINKKYINLILKLNVDSIPTIYDAPNNPSEKDFIINYPPFKF